MNTSIDCLQRIEGVVPIHTDRIIIKGMQFYGHHGCTPSERKLGQQIIVDVAMSLDLSRAGESDSLRHTVNYVSVYELVRESVTENQYRLIESLAARIADSILRNFKAVNSVDVEVRKVNPPVGGIVDWVAVQMTRKREDSI
ncbi:MAG TPA: dihydroneopterin aldolase [Armatimonadetes bacterium]|nr:dihydroneopterin aldolase [Armatimonadota bacterium]